MKSISNAILVAAMVFGSLGAVTTFSSCKKEETNSNTTPAVKDSDKFAGSWNAVETGFQDYQLDIKQGAENKVVLSKLTSAVDILNVNATVSGNTITIPDQTITNEDYQHVAGSGTLDAATNKINIKYTLKNDNGNVLPVDGVWTKK